MEYFLGSIITIATIFVVGKVFSKKIEPVQKISVGYSQSYIHEIVKVALPYTDNPLPKMETQSVKFNKELYHRVIITDDVAYWISNNQFFCAPFEDGFIKKDFAKLVDTINMDSVELKKITFIVEKLTEGDAAK